MPNPHKHSVTMRARVRNTDIARLSTNHAKLQLLLEYAILAPSTHNTQPWLLELLDSGVRVYADFSKKIPAADPTGRNMYMSIGALIYNFETAAREMGVRVDTRINKKLINNEHIADLICHNLEKASLPEESKVLDAITLRQNYRGLFDKKANVAVLTKIAKTHSNTEVSIVPIFESTKRKQLAHLTATGLKMAYQTPEFRREISSYINHNRSRKKHGLHGYSLRMTLPQSFIVPRVMRCKDIGERLAKLNYGSFVSAPATFVLCSDDTEISWLQAGRVLEQTWISLTSQGMTASMYAAAVEHSDLRKRMSKLLGLKKLPQIIFGVGISTAPLRYSTRKHLQKVQHTTYISNAK